jgi:hypothetical protein
MDQILGEHTNLRCSLLLTVPFRKVQDQLSSKGCHCFKDVKAYSPIAIRFQHDLKINGIWERTQKSCICMIRKFSEFLGRDLADASLDGLRYGLFGFRWLIDRFSSQLDALLNHQIAIIDY